MTDAKVKPSHQVQPHVLQQVVGFLRPRVAEERVEHLCASSAAEVAAVLLTVLVRWGLAHGVQLPNPLMGMGKV